MNTDFLLSPKQVEFVINSTSAWNLAHGSVRSGKTVGTLFRFMQAVNNCPDSDIYMAGHTSDTVYENVIKLLLTSNELSMFKKYCTWNGGKRQLKFRDKTIKVLGAKDEGAIGNFHGFSASLFYCDEMTLYPPSIIDMINSRLSKSHSMGFASMNPKHPTHILKQWINKAQAGDKKYYALHFTVDDNPYLPKEYIDRLKETSGIFYKRNYLGLWCLAEGSIFDFFDTDVYVIDNPPRAAEYYVAGIDVGTSNPFACVLVGVSTGKYTQEGKQLWVEKEYYWDPKKREKSKTNTELANDLQEFLEPYGVTNIYIDPSAAAFKEELRRRGLHPVDANNDVFNGIQMMCADIRDGKILICSDCKNLISEMESYVWDPRKAERGEDAPIKKDDHAIDALRYVLATHKVSEYRPYKENHNPDEYMRGRFNPIGRRFR